MHTYMADLICLDLCRPEQSQASLALAKVTTQLHLAAWEAALRTHPDRAFAHILIKGIRDP